MVIINIKRKKRSIGMKSMRKMKKKRVSSLILGEIEIEKGSVGGDVVKESGHKTEAISTYLMEGG